MSKISSVSVESLSRCMRGANPSIDATAFAGASPEAICDQFEVMIVDILHCVAKPAKGILAMAAEHAYQDYLTKDERKQLADRLMAAISLCREKAKSMSSGIKLPQSIRNITSVLRKTGEQTLAVGLLQKAERIQGSPQPPKMSSFAARLKQHAKHVLLQSPKKLKTDDKPLARDPHDELQQLRDLYGLPRTSAAQTTCAQLIDIDSSQEVSCNSGAASSTQKVVQYVTPDAVVRLHPGGAKETATLVAGKKGFLVAYFGEEEVETEMPNLLLEMPIKRPAAAMKKPAVSKKPSVSAAASGAPDETSDAGGSEDGSGDASEGDEVVDVISPLDVALKPQPFNFGNGDKMYFVEASRAPESFYIMVKRSGESKQSHVVTVTKEQCERKGKNYKVIALQIWKRFARLGLCDKGKAIKHKAALLG